MGLRSGLDILEHTNLLYLSAVSQILQMSSPHCCHHKDCIILGRPCNYVICFEKKWHTISKTKYEKFGFVGSDVV